MSIGINIFLSAEIIKVNVNPSLSFPFTLILALPEPFICIVVSVTFILFHLVSSKLKKI